MSEEQLPAVSVAPGSLEDHLQKVLGGGEVVRAESEPETDGTGVNQFLGRALTEEHSKFVVRDKDIRFPNEPPRFGERYIDPLLIHCARLGASDVNFQTDQPIRIELHGEHYPITNRRVTDHELAEMFNSIYGQNGSALMRQGRDLDPSHEIRPSKSERYRFRVNGTSCYAGYQDGMQITIRVIQSRPPKLADLNLEAGIIRGARPKNGFVVITGPTGSGKTTLLAGILADILEDENESVKIITYEAPIEYVYDEIELKKSIVVQHEIPKHLPSFPAAGRNMLRRAPDIILIGESRDRETVDSALEASETGHTVYTTVHANSVAETLYRMVNMFPTNERSVKMFELIEAFRMVVSQRLVPSLDGRRIALREYLVFDQRTRDKLRGASTFKEMVQMVAKMVEAKGQSMHSAALSAFNAKLISEDVCKSFEPRGSLFDDDAGF